MGKLHQDDVRQKIRVGQLLKTLQDHADGTISELAPTRLKAIELLLRKSMPDLSAVEMSGDLKIGIDLLETLKRGRGTG